MAIQWHFTGYGLTVSVRDIAMTQIGTMTLKHTLTYWHTRRPLTQAFMTNELVCHHALDKILNQWKKNHISSSVSCYQNTINNWCFDTAAQCSSQGFIVIKHVAFTKWFNFWSDKTSSVTHKRKYPVSSIVYVDFPLSPSASSRVKTFLS